MGRSPARLAPRSVPTPRKRINPNRTERRHPISRSTYPGSVQKSQRALRGVQAIHPFGLRGRLVCAEGPSAPDTEGKAVFHPVLAPPHAEGGEPVLLARPGDRTNPDPDPRDGRSSAALAALRVAPLDPRRLVVGPRIPHSCPGEGYRRPEEGGAEAARAPRRDRLGHERRFPRWGSGIGRFGGAASRIVRRRASHPGDPLPTPTETRPQEGPRSEGRPAASRPGGPEGTTSRAPAAPSGLQGPRAFRDRGAGRNRLGGAHSPRCRRPFPSDEPPPLLLAPP